MNDSPTRRRVGGVESRFRGGYGRCLLKDVVRLSVVGDECAKFFASQLMERADDLEMLRGLGKSGSPCKDLLMPCVDAS